MYRLLTTLNNHKINILGKNNVVSIGIGYKTKKGLLTNQKALIVGVVKKLPRANILSQDLIPTMLDNVLTDVVEVGVVKLLGFALPHFPPGETPREQFKRTEKIRPAPAGVSVGHYKITAGTLGAVVKGSFPGGIAILSNNHVLANLTDGKDRRASIGDPIYQPGPADGGKKTDTLAYLHDYYPLKWLPPNKVGKGDTPPSNLMDAALAVPVSGDAISSDIIGLRAIAGHTKAEPGMSVIKSGRTSGITRGRITAVHTHVSLEQDNRAMIFEQQIAVTPVSKAGDSGSLLVGPGSRAVGLVFAGSDKVTFATPIQSILDYFKVTL